MFSLGSRRSSETPNGPPAWSAPWKPLLSRARSGDKPMSGNSSRWRTDGVRIIRSVELDDAPAQTLGMDRRAAVTADVTGLAELWPGTVTIDANAKPGAHHHG